MEPKTKLYIDKVAEAVIQEYGLKRPFEDLDQRVQLMGGRIIEEKGFDELIDPSLRKVDEFHFEVIVPEQLSGPNRTKLVLLELGHLFLHMGFRTSCDCWASQDAKLRRFPMANQFNQAHAFALAIMMPKDEFRSVLIDSASGQRVDLERVSQHFNVSRSLVIQRGRYLNLIE